MSGLVSTSRAYVRTHSRSSHGVSPSKADTRVSAPASVDSDRAWSAASALVGDR